MVDGGREGGKERVVTDTRSDGEVYFIITPPCNTDNSSNPDTPLSDVISLCYHD